MKTKHAEIYAVCLALLASAFFASLCIGKYPISIKEVCQIISGQGGQEMAGRVFFNLRLPRTIMAFLAGAGLSMAGSIYQSIFRNPLAAPDLIGVTSGANAGAAFSIVCLQGGVAAAAGGAFFGGLLAVAAATFIAGRTRRRQAADFILAGVVIKAASDALIMTMKYLADPERQLAAIDYWSMGSLAGITADKALTVAPLVLVSFLGLFTLRRQIGLLVLEDDEARMLGVPVHFVRCIALLCTTLMVAGIISVSGSIAFIGLIAPHIARLLIQRYDFYSVILSGLVGSIVLLAADCLARSVAESEIPISILTSVLGVPALIFLLCRKEPL